MPYADKEVGRQRKAAFARRDRLLDLRDGGMEPFDVDDPHSKLECRLCGKVVGRSSPVMFRHYEWCFLWRRPKFWSRRKIQTEAGSKLTG